MTSTTSPMDPELMNAILSDESSMMTSGNKPLHKHFASDYQRIKETAKQYKKKLSPDQINGIKKQLKKERSALVNEVKDLFNYTMRKYNKGGSATYTSLLRKATKHADKFGVDSHQLQYLKIHHDNYLRNQDGKKSGVVMANNKSNEVAKVLGEMMPATVSEPERVEMSEDDKVHYDVIKMIHNSTKMDESAAHFHMQMYEDLAPHVMNRRYNPNDLHHALNIHNFTNPVVVALFAPKIASLDRRFLLSNLATTIVDKTRNKNAPFRSAPNAELFFNLTNDSSTDMYCDSSIWGDLKKRCDVQASLRAIVNMLRSGAVFDPRNANFIKHVHGCRMSGADTPHLLFNQDEGAVLRRLCGAMAYKPTHLKGVSQMPLPGFHPGVVGHHVPHRIPIMNVNLPHPSMVGGAAMPTTFDLLSGLSQPQLVVENGMLVNKVVQLMHTEQVLMFNVQRRLSFISPKVLPGNFFPTAGLPASSLRNQKINDTPVDYKTTIPADTVATNTFKINSKDFYLRSVVILDVDNVTKTIKPTGGQVFLFKWNTKTTFDVHHYHPYGVLSGVSRTGMAAGGPGGAAGAGPVPSSTDFAPFKWVCDQSTINTNTATSSSHTVHDLIRQRGAIFIYAQNIERNDGKSELLF